MAATAAVLATSIATAAAPSDERPHGKVDTSVDETAILANDPMAKRAVAVAASKSGLSLDKLKATSRGELSLPVTNQRFARFSITDAAGEYVADVLLDSTGAVVDEQKAIEKERSVKFARFGNAIEPFGRWLETAKQDELVEVAMAVRVEEDLTPWETLTDKTEEQSERIVARRVAAKERALAIASQALEGELNTRGWITNSLPSLGVVYAKVTVADARVIAKSSRVWRMEQAAGKFVPRLNKRLATRYADVVHGRGIRGGGATIGILEVGGGRVIGPITSLPNSTRIYGDQLPPPLWGASVTENPEIYSKGCGVNDHAIAMLGVMGSKSGYYGFAYGSKYAVSGMCANPRDNDGAFLSEAKNGMHWLINQGARVINASWGGPTEVNGVYSSDLQAMDLEFDRFGYTQRVTLVTSAGQAQSGYLDSPAKAYNVIAVGAFDDKGTIVNDDGVMWSASSWRNPTSYHNDRQKPEIVAPGVGPLYSVTRKQQTTTPGGSYCWECSYFADIGSGTSVAAAFVTGVVGQMMGRDARLKFQPEAVKAILLTTGTKKTRAGLNMKV